MVFDRYRLQTSSGAVGSFRGAPTLSVVGWYHLLMPVGDG